MATVLDISLLSSFTDLFAILFIFVLTYVVLEVVRLGGENKGLHAILALTMALIAAASNTVLQIISSMTPWFVLMFAFMMFLLMGTQFMGIETGDLLKTLGGKETAGWWVFAFAIIILIAAMSGVFGQQLLEKGINTTGAAPVNPDGTGTGSFNENVSNTIFHPKVLGLLLLMLIGFFTIRFIASGPIK